MPAYDVTWSASSTVANRVEDGIFGLKHSPIVQISILFNLFMVQHQRNWGKAPKRMELAVLMSFVSMFSHINMLPYYQTSDGAWNQEPEHVTPTTNRPCWSFHVWCSCLAFYFYTFPSRTLLWSKSSHACTHNACFLWLAQKNSLVWSQDKSHVQ